MIWHIGPYIGQRVVCINNETPAWCNCWGIEHNGPTFKQVCQIYRIENHLQGIGFGLQHYDNRLLYAAEYFRPLLEKPTDISALRQLINTPNMSVYDTPRIRENV